MDLGALGTARAKGFESSNLRIAWGERLKVVVHKTEATSRRLGLTSRHSRGFISQCRDFENHVAMLQKGEIATSRRWDPTSPHVRESINPTSRRFREWCQLTLQR